MSTSAPPDEPPSSSPVVTTVAQSLPPDSEPPETDPQRVERCPRCGGQAYPRRRRPSRLNPFLSTPPPANLLTCNDCGLDLDAPPPAVPWSKPP